MSIVMLDTAEEMTAARREVFESDGQDVVGSVVVVLMGRKAGIMMQVRYW